jgi:hypothetical protein
MIDIAGTPTNTVLASEGTPQLTINHEAIVDLDSSNAFEGMNISDIKPVPR